MRFLTLSVLLCCAHSAFAHHSYAGFDPDERYTFAGTITDISWGNPHILFTVADGNSAMRVEWITVSGAIKTDVDSSRFQKGEHLVVIGSRNRNPEIHVMTAIKELRLPAHDWQWISPSVQEKRP